MNAAMVLRDQMLADMTLETIQSQFRPKVHGSILVEELYGAKSDLDFFVLFGSAVGVNGNWGQSPYTAATNFMTSFIHGRRKRNLVGSIIHPSEIRGVGYFARKGKGLSHLMSSSQGTHILSEIDLHEMFAEAILAGRPDSGRNPVIIGGLTVQNPVERPDLIWYRSPKVSKMVDYCVQATIFKPGGQLTSMKEKLESATTMAEVAETVLAGLIAKLVNKLQLSADVPVTSESYSTELGLDSLFAVDLRNWFIKELGVDVPVLKILSGCTVGELADDATSKLSNKLLPSLSEEQEGPPEKTDVSSEEGDQKTPSLPSSSGALPTV